MYTVIVIVCITKFDSHGSSSESDDDSDSSRSVSAAYFCSFLSKTFEKIKN